jgi:hypothetical protein
MYFNMKISFHNALKSDFLKSVALFACKNQRFKQRFSYLSTINNKCGKREVVSGITSQTYNTNMKICQENNALSR